MKINIYRNADLNTDMNMKVRIEKCTAMQKAHIINLVKNIYTDMRSHLYTNMNTEVCTDILLGTRTENRIDTDINTDTDTHINKNRLQAFIRKIVQTNIQTISMPWFPFWALFRLF